VNTARPEGSVAPVTAAPVTRRVRVFRYKAGGERPRLEEFEVATGPRTTVLDALRDIRLHRDATLAMRHSCLHASCGTCGMRVNGREVLACVTKVWDLPPGPITVEPLANAEVVTDLVVDMADFYRRSDPCEHPLVRMSERVAPDGHEPYVRFEDCLECGLCLSACPVACIDPGYLGPAALSSAWRLVQEPRGADVSEVLARVDGEHGCWRCHLSFECSEVCPAGADPAGAIMRLRGRLVRDRFRELVGLGRSARRDTSTAGAARRGRGQP
jgi:succinate dehydrogenase / fumarate reductase iron-sulfur subunit